MTGLAGGDHLHFAVMLDGRPVSPIEWWDPHWIADRVNRKLVEAGLIDKGSVEAPPPASPPKAKKKAPGRVTKTPPKRKPVPPARPKR